MKRFAVLVLGAAVFAPVTVMAGGLAAPVAEPVVVAEVRDDGAEHHTVGGGDGAESQGTEQLHAGQSVPAPDLPTG